MYDTKLRNPQTEQLVKALLLLENEEECFRFLEDLFTIREVRDLAQRLEVAQMLVDKVTYAEIASRTGVSGVRDASTEAMLRLKSPLYPFPSKKPRQSP